MTCHIQPTTGVGYQFTDPFIYGGLGFAGLPEFAQCVDSFSDCKSTGSCSSVSDCEDLKICTYATSHHVLILEDIFPSTNIVPITIKENDDEFYQNFIDGNCNVLGKHMLIMSSGRVHTFGFGCMALFVKPSHACESLSHTELSCSVHIICFRYTFTNNLLPPFHPLCI